MPHLKLTLFGAPHALVNDQSVVIPRRKVMALLIYLAVTRQPQRRDKLATLFWPEAKQQTARSALRRELAALKDAIGDAWLAATREEIALVRDADIWIDVAAFRQHIAACASHAHGANTPCDKCVQHLAAAALLARDDFLAGFTLSDCPEFDDWQFFEVDGLRREVAGVLEKLVQIYAARDEFDTAIAYARRWLALDAMHEPVHRKLMRLYALADQQSAALRQYKECVRILNEELGVPPEEETTQLYAAIHTRQFPSRSTAGQEDPPALRNQRAVQSAEAPHASSVTRPASDWEPSHNLPAQPTPFIGREAELAATRQLLTEQAECRLLTLIGPGGTGKTRLAIEAASGVSESFHDGVFFVGLASVASSDTIVGSIADTLRFPLQGNTEPVAQLTNLLRTKEMLLVVDNLEHLLDGAALLGQLVSACARLTLLVTSREALGLQQEWLYPVQGFAAPDDNLAAADARQNAAVQLFVQRARRANSSLVLTDADLTAVARICRLVDGLPLALELAATWVGALGINEIADEIATNLDFLATPARDAPARHSSLRTVIAQTWQLLDAHEQAAFCKLAFFYNGFTRQAAGRVADVSIVTLAALVRKSILSLRRDGRYSMLALLRQFALEKLRADTAQVEAIAAMHSRYYGMFLHTLEDDLLGAAHVEALQKIEQELENIRHGWRWVLPHLDSGREGDDAPAVNLIDHYVEALFQFYDIRSRFQEGYTEFRRALTQLDALQPQGKLVAQRTDLVRGRVCGRLGWFAFQIGQPVEAIQLLQRSIDTLSALHADGERAFALNYLAAVHRHAGAFDKARQLLQDSMAICRTLNDQLALTIALNILGQIACEEADYADAAAYLEESLAIKKEIGDQRGITFSLLYLGALAQAQGAYAHAAQLLRESIAISEEHGDRRGIAIGLSHLADLEMALAHPQAARSLYEESLAIYDDIYNLRGIVTIRIKLGDLARSQNDLAETVEQYEVALRMASDLQVSPRERDALIGQPQKWLVQHA